MIRKELSFSVHSKFTEETTDPNENQLKPKLERTVTVGETVDDEEFSFGSNAMNMIEEDCNENDGAEGGFGPFDDGEIDGWDPSDPSFLRKYAQFLESKGEFSKAEEYYVRAMMENPSDCEALCLYAKLVWELYHDRELALSYFERAALAAPGDSNVRGAYASFLWEIDEEEEDSLSEALVDAQNGTKDLKEQISPIGSPLHLAMGLGLDMPSFSPSAHKNAESTETADIEEYYRGMLEKNSCNPLFLKDHTEFLHQSKEDLQAAEEYYSRALQEDSSNGPIMSQYANLVWQLYQDKERADACFKQAIEATPGDSDALASYAKFLWEIKDDDNDEEDSDKSWEHLQRGEACYIEAILENPRNSRLLSEYANVMWQLHGDKDRADAYFKQAIQATPEDSDVLASYAKFLWEIDDEDDDSS